MFLDAFLENNSANKIEKHTIIVVQATPNNQPGGDQGALFKLKYQSVRGPSFINQDPKAKLPKLMTKKNMTSCNFFILNVS